MANEFFVRSIADFKNLQEVDDSKGINIVLAVFVRCYHNITVSIIKTAPNIGGAVLSYNPFLH